jgi:magnesium transporter
MVKRYRILDSRLAEAPEGTEAQVLVYIAPDEKEKRYLVDQLHLDEHTMNSALDPDELSRLEFEPDHVALIYKRPKNYCSEDEFLFRVVSTGVFLFRDKLVLVMMDDSMLFEGKQFVRVNSLPDLVLRLIYRSIFHYEEHLKVINMISNSLEHEINKAMENRHLLNLFTLEKSLVFYVNAITSNAAVIDRLRNNAAKIGFTPENIEFIDDIHIENTQCHEQATIYSNILASLMDARASIVANNLNVLMKTLNIIMIGLMLPTLVVSVFSMNVRIPISDYEHAFWVICGLAGLSAVLVGFIWWYKKL